MIRWVRPEWTNDLGGQVGYDRLWSWTCTRMAILDSRRFDMRYKNDFTFWRMMFSCSGEAELLDHFHTSRRNHLRSSCAHDCTG